MSKQLGSLSENMLHSLTPLTRCKLRRSLKTVLTTFFRTDNQPADHRFIRLDGSRRLQLCPLLSCLGIGARDNPHFTGEADGWRRFRASARGYLASFQALFVPCFSNWPDRQRTAAS